MSVTTDAFFYIFIRYNVYTVKSQPLRQEKNCLNCGTEVPGRYCTECGQENTVTHESFPHLVKHFVADLLHYDSKSLNTLKYLAFRPGYLTKEYIAGRRASYVNPIKLYIFISFVFFLFTLPGQHSNEEDDAHDVDAREKAAPTVTVDSTGKKTYKYKRQIVIMSKDDKDLKVRPGRQQYDSLQATLPADQRDSWMERYIRHREQELTDKLQHHNGLIVSFGGLLAHNLPKLMFCLLPFFALLLKLCHNWKRWFFSDHAIFAIHLHTFAFLVLLFSILLDRLLNADILTVSASLWIFVYLVKALKRVYEQSIWKALLKSFFLFFSYLITMSFVFLIFLMVAVFILM